MVDLEQDINWGLQGNIGGIPAPGRTGASSVGSANWGGIVGVKGRWHFGAENCLFVPYCLDVGTDESNLAWQAMAGIGSSGAHWDVVASWRYLDYDMGTGRPFTDLSLNGPQLAMAYRW